MSKTSRSTYSIQYNYGIPLRINPVNRAAFAVIKRAMSGIFRSHGIRRGPLRGEGVVHPGAGAVVGSGRDLGTVAKPDVAEASGGKGCAAGKIQVGHSIEESIIHGQIGQIEGKTIFSYLFY